MVIGIEVVNLSKLENTINKIKNINTSDLLNNCGELVKDTAVEYADTKVHSSELAGSISNRLNNNTEEIYTNIPWAVYAEFGTGRYAENGNGRPGWWVWVDEECGAPKSTQRIIYTEEEAKACAESLSKLYGAEHVHYTQGRKPTRFLRSALEDNEEAIIKIIKDTIRDKL